MNDMRIPAIPEVTDNDVFITRAFDAPRDVMWKFWTKPEYLVQWFGPVGVHVDPSTVVVDLREGGRWDLDMVDDENGTHYPVRCTLTVVREPEYLEGRMASEPNAEGNLQDVVLRVWFHDHGAKTRITLHQGPFSPEYRDMTSQGWELSFQKIDALLVTQADA